MLLNFGKQGGKGYGGVHMDREGGEGADRER